MNAQDLVDRLNAYTGDNPWEDVIYPVRDHIDMDATGAADPSYGSDIVVLLDGDTVHFDYGSRCWRVGRRS